MPERRHWLLRVALFAFLLLLGAWPWDAVRLGFSRVSSAIGNPVLERLPVVQDVQLQLEALREIEHRTAEQAIQQDTLVLLRTPRRAQAAKLGISLRRDAYLPFLIFAAATLVLPMRGRSKLLCLGVGGALMAAVALASIWALVVYLLSASPGGGGIPDWEAQLVRIIFECWLTPPGNRVIAPLLLAAGLALATRRFFSPAARPTLPWESVPRVSSGPA